MWAASVLPVGERSNRTRRAYLDEENPWSASVRLVFSSQTWLRQRDDSGPATKGPVVRLATGRRAESRIRIGGGRSRGGAKSYPRCSDRAMRSRA